MYLKQISKNSLIVQKILEVNRKAGKMIFALEKVDE